MATKTSIFVKLLLGLCLLSAGNKAFAVGVVLPACSTMAGSNEICGVIVGQLTLISGPDYLRLAGSQITAVTGVPNADPATTWTAGWSVLNAPVPGASPVTSANYNIPLTLASNNSLLTLTCGTGNGAAVTLDASSGGDSLQVTSCNLDTGGIPLAGSSLTANLTFPVGTLAQAIPLPFSQVTMGSNSQVTYVCGLGAPECPTTEATVLGIAGTVSSTCVGCTTLGVIPSIGTGLSFTAPAGGSAPPSQTMTVEDQSPIAAVSYAITLATTSGGNWLSASTTGGQVQSSGSATPFNVSVTPGTLAAGVYHGTVTVYAPDRNGPIVEPVTLTLTSAPLTITTTSPLPSGEVGALYSDTLAATGGVLPYTWSITSGSLPTGLSLNTSSGAITGTPQTAGSTTFGVSVKDSDGNNAGPVSLTLTINAGPTITTTSLPNATLNEPYSQTLTETGGTSPFVWAVTVGSLPTGLSLNSSTGAITGSPTVSGKFSFSVTVTDHLGSVSPAAALSITVGSGLSITTLSVPNGVINVPYASTQLNATGGTTPYSWSVSAGALPTGLTLSSAGLLSGTPLASGSFTFTAKVTDSSTPTPLTATQSYTFTINPALTITTTSVPNGVVSVAYPSTQLVATGGTTPYSWSLSAGALPTGMSLSTAGVLSGTPSQSGSFSFTAKVTDSTNPTQTATQAYSFTIAAGLTITTTTVPNGVINAAYPSTQLNATGGTTPYSWAVSAGALPAGMSLSTAGVLSGTPSQSGSFNFTAKVTDSTTPTPLTATQSYSFTISAALIITTTSVPNGVINTAYLNTTLAATGGTTPYSWTVSAGALPTGMSLSSAGVLGGTPSQSGSFTFTAKVTDSSSPTPLTATQSYTFTIEAALTITTTTVPNGLVNTAYPSTQLNAAGGATPYTWSVSAGALPNGMSLSSAGILSGTPTASGSFSFTAKVTDSTTPTPLTATQAYTFTIEAALTITTTTVPNGLVNTAYPSTTLAATGGATPYSWSVSAGALPTGMSLSTAGVLSGVPSQSGSFTFTAKVTDSSTPTPLTATQSYTFTIGTSLTITTTTVPNGVVNTAYTSTTLLAQGGVTPYSWTVSAGALPNGMSLSTAGVLSGTPTSSGSFTFTAKVTDSTTPTPLTATQAYTFTIASTLTINTTTVPNGVLGVAYPNTTLLASGGTTPYSWTVSAGALPVGMSLSSAGILSGVPTQSGSFSFTAKVTDSTTPTPLTATQAYTLTIAAGLTITTTTVPNGAVGVAYPTTTLLATGGTTPYSWTISAGALPTGLTLSSAGVISGTPQTAGPFSFTAKVTDSSPTPLTATQAYNVTIVAGLTITTTTAPNGALGVAYPTTTLQATGGTTPYSWSISAGALPGGLTLSTAGVLSGTPSATGTFNFTAKVTDSTTPTPLTATQAYAVVIGSLTITTTTVPSGTVGVGYPATTLQATGGVTPYSWSISAGALPGGLSLSSAGVLSGTPTASGTFNFTVKVTDSTTPTALTATQALTLTVEGALSITTTSVPSGTVGVAYPSTTLQATGGTTPYTWSISAGALPSGLTLSAAGVLSGTPMSNGTFNFTAKVTDSTTPTALTATHAYSVTIGAALTITTTTLPGGTIGVGYSATLAATGGVPPYSNWAVVLGALPAGLTLNTATGIIAGTPTTAGTYSFGVTVRDSAGNTSPTESLSITIGSAVLKIGSPSDYFFTLANTAAPATESVTIVASDGSALPFTITAAPTNFNWLTFKPSSGTTPATITLTANPAGLAPGTYVSPLVVTSGSLTLTIPVQLTVTGSNLAATPTMLTFNYQPGAAFPPAQSIALAPASGTGTVPIASVTTDVGWLVTTSVSSAPGTIQVSINPGLLTPGTYYGDVLVKGQGSPTASLDIPVKLVFAAASGITVTPGALTFSYQTGGTAPAAQSFAVSSSNSTAVNFTVTPPGSWVQVSPASGTTPATVMVTVNPAGLAPGTYTGVVMVASGSGSATVAVTLTVTGAPGLTIAPTMLSFSAPVGGSAPAAQTIMLTSASGALSFTAAAGSTWLNVTPTSGTTPATLSVSVNPAGLTAGEYSGTINITPTGSVVPEVVIVTLGIGPTPTIAGVINAASGAAGNASPGMAMSIFGTNLGPATPATGVTFAAPPTGGAIATTLAGTQVLFDGNAVPLLFTINGQVNAMVPFELTKATTVLTVVYNGVPSAPMTLPVVATEPGLFTANASGTGQGAILNQDYSVNNAANPAAQGSAIMLFGTGGGLTDPPSADGTLNPMPPPLGALVTTPVTATVGGQPATVLYSGPAPGLVAGIFQINVTLPSGIASGNVPLTVTIGTDATATSQTVTVAVQ